MTPFFDADTQAVIDRGLRKAYRRSAHIGTVAQLENALLELLADQGRTLADGIETDVHLRLLRERLLSGRPNVAADGGLRADAPALHPLYPSPFFQLSTCQQSRAMRACVQAFYALSALPADPVGSLGYCDDEA